MESGKFINRELSWLEFNGRVLEEAEDRNNPLFERLKFTSIFSSNLDEFYMVRVASLADQVKAGYNKPDPAGLTPKQQMKAIGNRTHQLVKRQYDNYLNTLLPKLEEENIFFLRHEELNDKQRDFLEKYYWKNIYPVLTPMVVDQSRSFPLILNKSLNIAVLLENMEEGKEPIFATVQVPSVLGRFFKIPGENNKRNYILLEEVMKMFIYTIFRGHKILASGCFRITRNADLSLDEEGAEDLLEAIEESLKMRKWGAVIRLEVEKDIDERLFNILKREMDVPEDGVYYIQGPLDLTYLMDFSSRDGFQHLKFPRHSPQPAPDFINKDIYKVISNKDVLIHHPYQSFDPVVEMVERAAEDPNVLAIKQTLYRVSGNSPIVNALARAAENGKQVTVLVELKARFDEENNIIWARRLEKAGCHVIYGLVGLKTHAKVLLIVRKEEDGIKRYVHMGTGNYNDVTARIYTDIGLFTTNPYFGSDISNLFNMITGYSRLTTLYKVDIAPVALRKKFLDLIKEETENAKQGKKAKIIAKMNALVDVGVIEALYRASQAGVKIDLIVRGICCLRPGITGLSENIRVISIVGKFLEHSRIYYFYNQGQEKIYLSSADWMPRNLDRRVELLFPVESEENREEIKHILDIFLSDNTKARILQSNGSYERVQKSDTPLSAQEYFIKDAEEKVENKTE